MKTGIRFQVLCLCLFLLNLLATSQEPGGVRSMTACTSPGLYCNGGTLSTTPIKQNNIFFQLNLSAGQTTSLTNMLSTSTNPAAAHITGVLVSVPSGCLSGCSAGGPYIDYGGATNGGVYCPSPDFTSLDSLVSLVSSYGKLTNIVVAPAGYARNTETSAGVFSQGWANSLKDCSGNAIGSVSWSAGTHYVPGDYVKDNAGNYWLVKTGTGDSKYVPTSVAYSSPTATVTVATPPAMSLQVNQYVNVTLTTAGASGYNVVRALITGVTSNSFSYSLGSSPGYTGSAAGDVTGDAACVAQTSGPTSASTSPYTDGSGNNACTWYNVGANAPPQDSWVASSYPGASQKAYSLVLDSAATQTCSNALGTCTATLTNPYVGSAGDKITLSGTSTALDCSACTVSTIGTGANTVKYNHTGVSNFSGTIACGASCPLTAQRVVNANSTNGSSNLSVLASGLPTPYELPMKTYIKYICRRVYSHYASDTRVGYIRCGLSEGGEADTVGLNSNPGWPYGSQAVFIAYYNDLMSYQSSQASTNNLVCMGNLNSFDLPEGQISISQSCGIGTNGYKADDVIAITAGSCLTIGAIQSDWCWNFAQYGSTAMPNGNKPILELQTSDQSTPGTNTAGHTGELSAETGWTGLVQAAVNESANDGEWYMCDFGLAYDSSYPTGCSPSYSTTTYRTKYKTAFAVMVP